MKEKSKQSIFKFDAWWLMETSFEKEVKNIWQSSSGDILTKLNALRIALTKTS